jgi:carbamoyl-phosphate synthase large subunit
VRADEIAQMDIPSFPVVVKPRFGFGSNGINYAHNREEVDFFLKYYAHEEMIVQEFIGGPEYSFDILNDFNANFVTAAVKKKIKMRSGETDQGYAFKDREMLDVARELGQRLGHIGPLDVDFFMKDGKPHILELNPRFGGGYAITHMAGLDFTKILIELYYGKLDPADYDHYSDYEEGIVMIKDILFHQANTKTK